DPRGPQDGSQRVVRGGSWFHLGAVCRSACRLLILPTTSTNYFGFRVVCAVPTQAPPTETVSEPIKKDLPNSIGMKFVRVPRGTFWMGGGGGKPGDRQVKIPRDFELGVYPVTQEQWQAVMGSNPSYFFRTEGGKDQAKDIADADLQQHPVQ